MTSLKSPRVWFDAFLKTYPSRKMRGSPAVWTGEFRRQPNDQSDVTDAGRSGDQQRGRQLGAATEPMAVQTVGMAPRLVGERRQSDALISIAVHRRLGRARLDGLKSGQVLEREWTIRTEKRAKGKAGLLHPSSLTYSRSTRGRASTQSLRLRRWRPWPDPANALAQCKRQLDAMLPSDMPHRTLHDEAHRQTHSDAARGSSARSRHPWRRRNDRSGSEVMSRRDVIHVG
jgi:hypothetical protein